MTALSGSVALVTGANRGIGKEFVQQLLDRGAAKVYAAARDPRSATHTDPRVVPLALDVTDPDSIARAAEQAPDVNVLVNNAGISTPTPVLNRDTSKLRRELEVNLFGPLAVTSAFIDSVVEGKGVIVNVASALSWLGLGGSYSISKAALWSATDSMRIDLAAKGVQVVGVYMGYVDTDMAAGVEAPKTSPDDVVRQVLDGVEAGELEVLADQTARDVRASLHLPVATRYAPFGLVG
ncbi:MAG: putative short-chain dehydrogenase/reductase [Aeromicrobium sp.]|nr:putative short-chain dehydrogenase/reductase [Aeromicrobium sp.]